MAGAEPESGSRAAWTAAALLLLASLLGAVVLAEWPLTGSGSGGAAEPRLVEPVDNGTQLWPYTARGVDHGARTLGINLVVQGDREDVRRAMLYRSELDWRQTEEEEEDVDVDRAEIDSEAQDLGDVIRWGEARGATRYTYVVADGQSIWMVESYQLHSGTYLGSRLHVRAYEDPEGEWTAMQAHNEHWDWFRLRHTVTGISSAQREVERDFMGAPFVEEVTRVPYDNATADSDGWVTVVRLALLLPALAAAWSGRVRRAGRTAERLVRRHHREAMLGAAVFSLYLGVRAAGIVLEGALSGTGVSPKVIAGPLYVALVIGLPAIAYVLGRDSHPAWSLAHAAGGLGTAFVIDFAAMGVSFVPMQFVLHRLAVLLAIGMIAVGSSRLLTEGDRRPLYVGIAGWVLALVLPLLGYL